MTSTSLLSFSAELTAAECDWIDLIRSVLFC